jgi:hypothetical protein
MLGAALAALGGCQLTTFEPTPLRGPSPQGVAVWPTVAEAAKPFERDLLAGADAALRGRGYHAPSVAVAAQLLGERGLLKPGAEPADLARIGKELGVDAVLCFDVRQFEVPGGGTFASARWDVGWRLLSTRGHGVLWEHEHHGAWVRRDLDTSDPHRALDAEPDYVQFGGDRQRNFRDVADLAASLHRMACAHLPKHQP